MQAFRSSKYRSPLFLAVMLLVLVSASVAQAQNQPKSDAKTSSCPNDDTGLTLPAGFCATIFADNVGHARHMVVAPDGVL